MKQLMMFAVFGLISLAAFSQVVVLQDGKTITYRQGTGVTVFGKTVSRVLYDGVLITVPKGQKVRIGVQENEMGKKILISGTNLKDVEIAGKSVSSKGRTIISVSPETLQLVTIKGETTVNNNGIVANRINRTNTDKENKTNKSVKTNNKQLTPAVSNEVIDFPEISDYVNEVVVQQAVQDVERSDMSQSSVEGA